MTDVERWRPWTDDDLRQLLARARATGKTEQVAAIANELARRQDARSGELPPDEFAAGERGFLEQLAALLEAWGVAFESDDRLFLRVGERRWMAFQHLDGPSIRHALAVGGPPARRAPADPTSVTAGLAPELGGR